MPEQGWYITVEGAREGPVNLEALVQRIMQSPDPAHVLVWSEGFPAWVPPSEVPEVARKMPPPVPRREDSPPSHNSASSAKQQSRAKNAPSLQVAWSSRFRLSALPFVFAVVLLGLGILGLLMRGELQLRWLSSGLLYLAYSLAIDRNHPLARGRWWSIGALPIIIFPLGMIIFVATFFVSASIRREHAQRSVLGKGRNVMANLKDGARKTCPDCSGTAVFRSKCVRPGSSAAFVGPGGEVPDPPRVVAAWSCDCGYFREAGSTKEERDTSVSAVRKDSI